MSARTVQPFEHDGFNSPNEVEVAKRAALHTPGPWSVKHDAYIVQQAHADRPIGAHVDPLIDREKYAHTICTMAQRFGVNEADSRLIAAAPDLLEALELMLNQFTKTPSTFRDSDARCKAHAAILKATGSYAIRATGSASHG
jgi:hypothetical protein